MRRCHERDRVYVALFIANAVEQRPGDVKGVVLATSAAILRGLCFIMLGFTLSQALIYTPMFASFSLSLSFFS